MSPKIRLSKGENEPLPLSSLEELCILDLSFFLLFLLVTGEMCEDVDSLELREKGPTFSPCSERG